MRYVVKITARADKDLRSIFEYIAFELQSMSNATGQLERLESAIEALSEMPERYPRYTIEPWYTRGLRMMPVDNYCVFYIPDRNFQTVEIIRVMYGGRDIKRILLDYAEESWNGKE